MSKKQTALCALFLPLAILIGYFLYVTIISGQPYTSINLLQNTKAQLGNFSFSSIDQSSTSKIDPLPLSPKGNPYRINLTVGYTHKVGRASLKQTEYSHHLTVRDPSGQILKESSKTYKKKNKLGGNTKLTVNTESLGTLRVTKDDIYDLDLKVDSGNAEIHSIQLHIRKNVVEFNPIILILLILSIFPGFILTIKNFSKKERIIN